MNCDIIYFVKEAFYAYLLPIQAFIFWAEIK